MTDTFQPGWQSSLDANKDSKIDKKSKAKVPKKLGGLFKWYFASTIIVTIFTTLYIIAHAYGIWAMMEWYHGRQKYEFVEISQGIWQLVLLANCLFCILLGFLFLRFTFRALSNLHIVKAANVDMKPWWSVIWNFVPILWFWKPFEGYSEMWAGSMDPEGDPVRTRVEPHKFLQPWWMCWVMSFLCSKIASMFLENTTNEAGVIDSFSGYSWGIGLEVFATLMWLSACLLVVPIFRQIAKVQDETFNQDSNYS